MKERIDLPKPYTPFHEMVLCSNRLIDVQIPFEVDGGIPLLIGQAQDPLIWLNARPASPGQPWQPVVRQN